MRIAAAVVLASSLVWQSSAPTVPYPDGYRAWTHVKSAIISPTQELCGDRRLSAHLRE